MAARASLPTDARYVLTDSGRAALQTAETCACSQLFVSDGVYQCMVCQTIYSVVFGFTIAPRKLRTRGHARAG